MMSAFKYLCCLTVLLLPHSLWAQTSMEEQVYKMIKTCDQPQQDEYMPALVEIVKRLRSIDPYKNHFQQRNEMVHYRRLIKTLGDEVYVECILSKKNQA